MELAQLALELKEIADAHPIEIDPATLKPMHPQHRRDLTIDGSQICIQFTKEHILGRWFYHLSIGNLSGNPKKLSPALVEHVRSTFLPQKSFELPSVLGNCVQFVMET